MTLQSTDAFLYCFLDLSVTPTLFHTLVIIINHVNELRHFRSLLFSISRYVYLSAYLHAMRNYVLNFINSSQNIVLYKYNVVFTTNLSVAGKTIC